MTFPEWGTAWYRPTCGDCRRAVGNYHDPGCDVERCMFTGLQLIDCEEAHDHWDDRNREVWSGYFPGSVDCVRLSWLRSDGWPDLNRLYQQAKWDPKTRRWEER